ncbi:MAG: diaminobutyrate--2-oxoglutarate transaminase [Lachnospiraceae bacterium]|nr:diaminobutyrate--2-oxoglutarate transaminase [Lachnospiraceae bacterium]
MEQKKVFETYESEVRSYCRSFPSVFQKAKGSIITDVEGNDYLDFFCGAGAVNYGHNNDYIKEKMISYLQNDGILHALDMMTDSKAEFLEFFEEQVLKPRGLDYKVMFVGPTGTNGVEAALKLARKVKQRTSIWALMGCFHGMTLASLALTSDKDSRKGAGIPLEYVTHIPAPYMFEQLDTISYMETLLTDDHSGIEKPAAIIIETVQAEGGIHVFEKDYLQNLRRLCDRHDILLIVDDIQVGCARTGTFFSFERADIIPDMVILSKSIGGAGLPFALTLFKPELDLWTPGEHNGTFRGNQLAIVAAKAGLEYMLEHQIEAEVQRKSVIIEHYLTEHIPSDQASVRGIGMIWGIDVYHGEYSSAITKQCFENGLIIERAGRDNSVVKLMPALTISDQQLLDGLNIICNAVNSVLKQKI